MTQNEYDLLNELDLGKTPIASKSMRVKFKSSQSVHIAGRESDADFDALDKKLTECQTVNQEVLDWAFSMTDEKTMANYESVGEQLVEMPDKEQPNGGLWII